MILVLTKAQARALLAAADISLSILSRLETGSDQKHLEGPLQRARDRLGRAIADDPELSQD